MFRVRLDIQRILTQPGDPERGAQALYRIMQGEDPYAIIKDLYPEAISEEEEESNDRQDS